MKLEYNDQSQGKQPIISKQCQICDSPMQEAEPYCHGCGALWCETDNNLEEKIVLLFDPLDVTQYSLMPLRSPPAGYSGFSLA